MSFKLIPKVGADCVACGCCVKHCPFEAISVYKGLHATVDLNKCRGCGKCAGICPADVVTYEKKEVQSA